MRCCQKIIDHLPIRGRNVIYIYVKHFLYLVCSNVTVITILFIIFPTTIREKTFKLVLHENAIKELTVCYRQRRCHCFRHFRELGSNDSDSDRREQPKPGIKLETMT